MKRSAPIAILLLAVTVAATPAGATAPTKKSQPTITVLVTNDDGVAAPGIDAVVEALRTLKNTKVVVVAPAENQSGAGSKTTPGGGQGSPATTASGYAATAVVGFPADSVNYAFDVQKVRPNVVISGSNSVQNMGELIEVSGTVGAARQAALRGIPALAISQQLGDSPEFPTSGKLAAEWLKKNRKAFTKPKLDGPALAEIDNINAPNCPGGQIRGLYSTVLAPAGTPDVLSSTSNCASTATSFPHDVAAFGAGYATITKAPAQPASQG